MHRLVNVPFAKSGVEIKGVVEGEQILLIASETGKWRDGRSVMMTDMLLGDHMLTKPEALRQMVADALATAVRMARDAGYAQAKAELREWIGR